ncbi:heterokaryon incompatibility protein-domain-containing protein [Phyllosticta capitalensis]|uniref:heterokaryon incompatibility protein-domain-containing protein n=1 Tax=Phyllosticta capitalensis TaxID=121624 RepID=UPI00312D7197
MARYLRSPFFGKIIPERPTHISDGDLIVDFGHVHRTGEESTEALLDANSTTQHHDPAPVQAPNPAELYQSLPLGPSRAIRLLELKAAPRNSVFGRINDAPLEGHLSVVSLADSPRFTALSYVWGDFSSNESEFNILLNDGYRLKITPNCHAALTSIRKHFGATMIWVDAICMNQDDEEEKKKQIPLMEEIYTWAECTYVWLGSGSVESDNAMRWLIENSKRCLVDEVVWAFRSKRGKLKLAWAFARAIFMSAYFRPIRWVSLYGKVQFDAWKHYSLDLLITKLRKRLGLSLGYNPLEIDDLFGQAWFKGVWTFQEFLLSTNLIFLYGDHSINGSKLMGGIEQIYQPVDSNGRRSAGITTPSFDSFGLPLWPSPHGAKMKDLTTVWMNINRPTHWNDFKKCAYKKLPKGTSGRAYQEEAFRQVLGKMWVRITLLILHHIVLLVSVINVGYVLGIKPTNLGAQVFFWMVFGVPMHTWILVWEINDFSEHTIAARSIRLGIALPQDSLDSETVCLSSIIEAIRNRDATDPKDRSFAVFGVLGRLNVNLPEPNYDKSLGHIYWELLTSLIRWQSRLVNLVVDASITQKFDDDAPSWVPNWDKTKDNIFYDPDRLYRPTDMNATFGWTPAATVEGKVLKVSGSLQDTVLLSSGEYTSLSDQNEEDTFESADEDNLWDALYRFAHWIHFTRCNSTTLYNSVPETVLRVLYGTVAWPPTPAQKRGFDTAYRIMSSANLHIFTSFSEDKEQHEAFRRHVEDDGYGSYAVSYMVYFINRYLSIGRTVFTTREGYVGAGPAQVTQNDQIALIAGVGVPMVLREQGEDEEGSQLWVVVGPAFIPGYMEGEIPEDEVILETIRLV